MTWNTADLERTRVRRAEATLKRVTAQREKLTAAYAIAQDPRARLYAVADLLRAAAKPGKHQPDDAAADAAAESVAEFGRGVVLRLLTAQTAAAEQVLTTERSRADARAAAGAAH